MSGSILALAKLVKVNERGDNKRWWREERQRYRLDGVGAAPGEKSAERQCRRVGSASMSVHHTHSQGVGGGGEGGTETTPPGARPTTMGSQDANMTTMTIVMVVLL